MVDSKLTMLLDLMVRMFRVHPRDSVIMNMVMMNLVDIKEEEVIIEYHQEHQGMFSINYCLFARVSDSSYGEEIKVENEMHKRKIIERELGS